MRTCQSCGLPAATWAQSCAFCGDDLEGASNFEIVTRQTHFALMAPGAKLADARLEDGIWRIYEQGSALPTFSLLPMRREGRFSVALIEEETARATKVVVRTRFDGGAPERLLASINDEVRTTMVIYTDGPTGFHMVNRHGDVVALASPKQGGAISGLDLVSVLPETSLEPSFIFGIFLSIILSKVSHPGCDFTDLDHICLDASSEG